MSWPLSQDYNEAIQDPRNSFNDAELKTGEAVSNALGIPMPRSGNFADVYEVRCPSGARWAVKCFTREVHGLRERYAEISKYLRQANLPFMVDFQYLEKGIRVRSQWFPILKMQWVEGFVLNEFVRDNLDKKPILHALGRIWLRMARRLREGKLAHGDLQHGNIMFVPGSNANSLAVKLIDYDGMCVPSLAGKNSGEVGHPAYQHPERLRNGAYNQEVDRFSLLSITAALRCLTVGGRSLWQRYDNGDNLLFRQTDLQEPKESPLFRELLTIADPQAQRLVTELYRACRGPLSEVPLLTDLEPEQRPAAKATTFTGRPAAAIPETDWDFSDAEPDAPLIRKRRSSAGVPLALWGALGGAAALVVSLGIGFGLLSHSSPDKKMETRIVQNKSTAAAPIPTPKPQPPNNEQQPPTKPVNPPPKPKTANSPPKPAAVETQVVVWNPPVDPDGDCAFQKASGKLTITVPGTDHDLGAERGRMNAPRLLCDVKGDFTVQVRVSGDFQSSTDATVAGKVPVVGAGLVLLIDDKTYVRLERFRLYRRERFENSGSWELRQDGQPTFAQASPQLREKETYLRLKRRGNKLRGSISEDGQNWINLRDIDMELPEKIKIGVDAILTSSRPFAPSFDQFQFQQGQMGLIRIDWPPLPAPAAVTVLPSADRVPPMAGFWGQPWDTGGSKFMEVGGKLTITLPGKENAFDVQRNLVTNRASVVRAIKGDFTAQVSVSGDFPAATGAMTGGRSVLWSAGLILSIDENTYMRLERLPRHGEKQEHFAEWWLFRGPKGELVGSLPLTGKKTSLRLERRGDKIDAFVNDDGRNWTALKPIEIKLPARAQVGVIALSTSSHPFAASFDQFLLKRGQANVVRVEKWLAPKPRRSR